MTPPAHLGVSAVGPSCQEIDVRWDADPAAVEYRVYLDGEPVRVPAGADWASLDYLLPDTHYTIGVSAVDAAGDESDRSEVEATTLAIPPLEPAYQVNALLVRYADTAGDVPVSATEMSDRLYGESHSVNAYFDEVSYHRTRIEGRVYDWQTLPEAASHYHTGGSHDGAWWAPVGGWILDDLPALFPPEAFEADAVLVYLDGTGDAGISAGRYKFLSAGDLGLPLRTAIHEIGHEMSQRPGQARLDHPAGWQCPNATVGPNLDDPLDGGCTSFIYGYEPYDPMGYGTRQFMSYHKWLLGMLPASRIATVDKSGNYDLVALEIDTDGIQMLRIPIADGRFAFAEFRRPIGFDGEELDPRYPDFTNGDPLDAVIVRLRPAPVWSEDAFRETLLPYDGDDPVLLGEGDRFEDPYRGIVVEVRGTEGDVARVRVGLETHGCACDAGNATPWPWMVLMGALFAARRR